jgi:hypothetical protein
MNDKSYNADRENGQIDYEVILPSETLSCELEGRIAELKNIPQMLNFCQTEQLAVSPANERNVKNARMRNRM